MPSSLIIASRRTKLVDAPCTISLDLALVVREVSVTGGGTREAGPAVRARYLGSLAVLFALVSEKVAEGRELPPVASVVPALRLRPRVHQAHMRRVAVRSGH